MSRTDRYTRTAMSFHWLIALLIVGTFILGLFMTSIPGLTPAKLRYFSYHKSIGVTIFALACLRLWWRHRHPPPPLPANVSSRDAWLARAVHILLYLLMFAVPLSGYFYSLAAGVPVKYLGQFTMPVFIPADQELKPVLQALHFWLNMTLAACLLLHVAGTAKHSLTDKVHLLKRMWP